MPTEPAIALSLSRGLDFLAEAQSPCGQWAMLVARHESMAHAIPLGSVFPASFVLHTLRLLQNYDLVKPLAEATVNFVLKERGPDGLWRGFSSPTLPADCDTTLE